ncbi:MAG: hypothetical protein JO368_10180 [Acidimicrobiales bacterium]|nr:hypothetical protein [Acidimicrobiales bacterium]
MSALTRTDRLVVAGLLAVLAGLAGLALAQRSGAARPHRTLASGAPVLAPPSLVSPSAGTSPAPKASAPSAGGAPTTVPPITGTATTSTLPAPPVPGPVYAVGDSLMLDIQPYLQTDLPGVRVDGMVSRQFETGIGVVQAARAAGTLGSVLVVELGTNGSVTSSDVDAMMQAAAGVQRVVFVNIDVPRPWAAPDNAVLAASVARYPGVAVLADWYTLSSPHPEWFAPDQVHLQPAGAAAMAALIASDA